LSSQEKPGERSLAHLRISSLSGTEKGRGRESSSNADLSTTTLKVNRNSGRHRRVNGVATRDGETQGKGRSLTASSGKRGGRY